MTFYGKRKAPQSHHCSVLLFPPFTEEKHGKLEKGDFCDNSKEDNHSEIEKRTKTKTNNLMN